MFMNLASESREPVSCKLIQTTPTYISKVGSGAAGCLLRSQSRRLPRALYADHWHRRPCLDTSDVTKVSADGAGVTSLVAGRRRPVRRSAPARSTTFAMRFPAGMLRSIRPRGRPADAHLVHCSRQRRSADCSLCHRLAAAGTASGCRPAPWGTLLGLCFVPSVS